MKEAKMRVVTTRQASELTGLSTEKLREWTNRRELIPADIRPKNQGSPAKYTWQTILLLRIAVTLRDRFHVELEAHRQILTSIRHGLQGMSFVALWGKSLAIYADHSWAWIEKNEFLPTDDAIVIRMAPHLEVLSESFALPNPLATPGQLNLFPAHTIAERLTTSGALSSAQKRRQSA